MTRREFLPAALGAYAAARSYRVALIGDTGHGNFGHDWDLTWKSFPNVQVVGVADPNEAGRRKAIERSGARAGYADYRKMLDEEKPDIVAICPRWLDQRVAMVTAAAEAGAHVLLEKPFARSVEDGDRMVAALERHKRKLLLGHTARPMGVTQRVRDMLREGQLGTLMEMRARGKEDRRAGGEDLIVLGTHCFDLMRYFAGDPAWVFAHVTQGPAEFRRGMEREATEPVGRIAGDRIAAMYAFPAGVHGYFGSKTNDVVEGKRFGVAFYCSKGVAFVPLLEVPGGPAMVMRESGWAGGKWEQIDYPENAKVTTREQTNAIMAADLMEAIEKGREPICGARDGLWTIEMVEGIYQSQLAGAPVRFPLAKRSS